MSFVQAFKKVLHHEAPEKDKIPGKFDYLKGSKSAEPVAPDPLPKAVAEKEDDLQSETGSYTGSYDSDSDETSSELNGEEERKLQRAAIKVGEANAELKEENNRLKARLAELEKLWEEAKPPAKVDEKPPAKKKSALKKAPKTVKGVKFTDEPPAAAPEHPPTAQNTPVSSDPPEIAAEGDEEEEQSAHSEEEAAEEAD